LNLRSMRSWNRLFTVLSTLVVQSRALTTSCGSLLESSKILKTTNHKKTIIWLHGLGDSSDGFQGLFEQLQPQLPGTKVILPNAPSIPVTLNGGMMMRAWYDILTLERTDDMSHEEDTRGIEESDLLLKELLDKETKEIGSENIVIGGFSQGGAMAIYTGLSYGRKLAGIISCSGYLLQPGKYPQILSKENKDTHLLTYHGEEDPMVQPPYAEAGYLLLKEHGVNIESIVENYLEHNISPKEVARILKFFKDHLKV